MTLLNFFKTNIDTHSNITHNSLNKKACRSTEVNYLRMLIVRDLPLRHHSRFRNTLH